MFKNITINLETTICDCEFDKPYDWIISIDSGMPQIKLTCQKCGTILIIPGQKLFANYNIKHMPEVNKKQPKQKHQSVGNVTYLFKKDN